jgi:endonuclease YncB( thermonuclease family)
MRLGRMASQWASVLVLLLILALLNHYRPDLFEFDVGSPQQNTPRKSGGGYDAIDGDSFRAGKTEVRLHGIDAPEYRQTCSDKTGAEMACGKLARDALSALMRDKTVTCKTLEKDRYGRHVSVCSIGKTEINREMVRLGWALAYRKHDTAYIAAENEARKAKRGIWQWEFEKPEDYRKRSRQVEGSMAGED